MTDCNVRGNSANGTDPSVNGHGGGLMCWDNSAMTVANCAITENSAGVGRAGLLCGQNSSVNMTDCIIIGNSARISGGGVGSHHGTITMTNCVITRNTAVQGGGGVLGHEADDSLTIRNCTIWGNSAGGPYYGGGILCYGWSSVKVTNSIIWGNTSPRGNEIALTHRASALTVTYSDIADGKDGVYVEPGCMLNWGEGNIDSDPLFAEPGYWANINNPNIIVEPDDPNAVWIDGDYHLKSEAGRWDPYSKSWVLDDVTSPCIDRGDPNSPFGDEPIPNGGIINMGAYGGTPEASMSIGTLPPLPPLPPIAHWKLDETEGDIAYDSIGDSDGTLNGEPLWQPEVGMVDGALQLDGINDYISVPFVLNLEDRKFSIFIWIKGGAPGQKIISQKNGINWLSADDSEGKLASELVSGRDTPLISDVVITDGQWHRVGLIWDGAVKILYVDDVEAASDALTNFRSSEDNMYIGAGNNLATGTFFSGLIDDVRIYNRAVIP